MLNLTTKEKANKIEKEVEFNKLYNDININWIKGSKEAILFIAESITNRETVIIYPIGSSFRNKTMLYSNELPFGIFSSDSFCNIETMNAISFCYDKDYYDFTSVIKENCYYKKISNIKLLQSYLTIDDIDFSLIH